MNDGLSSEYPVTFSDLLPDLIKSVIPKNKALLFRCICKDSKSNIERSPGIHLRLSIRGLQDVSEGFLSSFTSVCIICPVGWSVLEYGWSDKLFTSIRNGLRIKLLDISLSALDMKALLNFLIDSSASLHLENMTLRFKVFIEQRTFFQFVLLTPSNVEQGRSDELEKSMPQLAMLATTCILKVHVSLTDKSTSSAIKLLRLLRPSDYIQLISFGAR
jgi:hypothetical protein